MCPGVLQGCGPVRSWLAGGLVAGTRVIPTGPSEGLEPPEGEEDIYRGLRNRCLGKM